MAIVSMATVSKYMAMVRECGALVGVLVARLAEAAEGLGLVLEVDGQSASGSVRVVRDESGLQVGVPVGVLVGTAQAVR